MNERRLGRGLKELLMGHEDEREAVRQGELLHLPIDQVAPNPHQPRKEFDAEDLAELAESIAQNGVLQPVVVRKVGEKYELIAGERRWRAASQVGLPSIPAVVRTADEQRALELSLIENIQRQDLNPIEKAKAFKELLDSTGLTQEEVAQRLGRNRSSLANMIRLLELPEDIQETVSRGTISMGHARALLTLGDVEAQRRLCRLIVDEDLSVRQVEEIVSETTAKHKRARPSPAVRSPQVRQLEDQLRRSLGTRVTIVQGQGNRGRIVIDYFSAEEFERIFAVLAVEREGQQ